MNSCELLTFLSTITCCIAKCSTREEMSMLSAIFSQIGVNLATILVNEEICNKEEGENREEDGIPII